MSTSESQKCLLMQRALPVCSAMFQLCGCDFMSDSDGINIFFKSWLLVFIFPSKIPDSESVCSR